MPDSGECLHQTQRMRVGEEGHWGLYGFVDLLMISAIEKHLDWHAENGSDLEEPPRANAVGAVLVLLHLLECHVEPFGESCLGHASFKAQDADVVADYSISGVALSSGLATSTIVSVWMNEPATDVPPCATMSTSQKPGGGLFQSLNVRIGTLRRIAE